MSMDTAVGLVLDVQRFCTHDGPGIRTTVFLKGCPLDCAWCHNLESKRSAPELGYDPAVCTACGACAARCPRGCHTVAHGRHGYDRAGCTACGACRNPGCSALSLAGQAMTVDEVMAVVQRDRPYYQRSQGGLTLSGGEPLYQPAFALQLLQAAQAEGLHTAVETCGAVPETVLRQAVAVTDLFLYDYKLSDPARHRDYTGVDNARILRNLAQLDALGAAVILRCPLIPGINDTPDHLAAIAAAANRLPAIRAIELEPYHPLGEGKAARFGHRYALAGQTAPGRAAVDGWLADIARQTATPVRLA